MQTDTSITDSILASFIWSVDAGMGDSDTFILNLDIFGDKDSITVASLINEETTGDKCYSILNMRIEQTMPNFWLRLSLQTSIPLSVVKRMHDNLVIKSKLLMMTRV